MGWTFSLFRIVTWAVFHDSFSNQEFLFISTHFDNNGANKEPSANLFLDRIRPFTERGIPVIAVGDFNSNLESSSYQILTSDPQVILKNTLDLAEKSTLNKNTYFLFLFLFLFIYLPFLFIFFSILSFLYLSIIESTFFFFPKMISK